MGIETLNTAARAAGFAVGFGGADKIQVAHMVRQLLHVVGPLSADAADALAVAICHANGRRAAAWVASAGPRA